MTEPIDIYHDIGDEIRQFIRRDCESELAELLEKYPNEKRSFWIDWGDIYRWEPNVADDFLTEYEKFQTVFEMAVRDVDHPVDIELDGVTVRLYNLPEGHTYDVGECRSEQVNELVGVVGQIAKTSSAKLELKVASFRCGRCGTLTDVPQSIGQFQEPNECMGCERQGPFNIDLDHSEYRDHKLIKLQQPPEEVADGESETIVGVVVDDLEEWLTDRGLSAGARVTVNGMLRIDESTSSKDDSLFDYYLEADSIEVEEQDYEEIDVTEHKDRIKELANDPQVYEKLVDSLATDIQGDKKLRDIKLSIILQMFGGYRRLKPDGTAIRGDIHILLIGDPATGKSSLLDAVKEISPRSIRTSGKNASAAGMTAAAVRDEFGDGQYSLEAGALALAHKGVACVDEIDKMNEDAVESMHTALEQQVINVNKGGISASIPAQTALLAAGNPKEGRFGDFGNISEQVDVEPALLSRFDLWFILQDEPEKEHDRNVASGKLDVWQETADIDHGDLDPEDAGSVAPEIDHDVLRAYIAYARRNVNPRMTDEAGEKIVDYYANIRDKPDDDTVALTARKLEAARRLAEASARVRLSEAVEVEDVTRALTAIGRSLADMGINEEGEFDADIVETGESKPQRDRIQNLWQLINSLEGKYDDGVPLDEIIETADEELGIAQYKAEREIEKLKNKGELYEPATGELLTS